MVVFEIIQEIEQKGHLKKLIAAGLMSTKLVLYYEIYLEYDKAKRTTKKKTVDIVSELCDKFGVCDSTIYKVIKIFK